MEDGILRDDQWERLKPFVPGGRKGKRGPRSDGRRFFDAVLWLARSGGRWRDLPVRFELGHGQQNDMAPACDLIRGLKTGQILADRADDADRLHDLILDQGGEPVIPPRRHRKDQHAYDRIADKHRWGIEGFFAKLKQWRRIAPATTRPPPTSWASSSSPESCSGSDD